MRSHPQFLPRPMRGKVALVLAGMVIGGGAGASRRSLGSARTRKYTGANLTAPRWERYCKFVGMKERNRWTRCTWLAGVGGEGTGARRLHATPPMDLHDLWRRGPAAASGALACFKRPVGAHRGSAKRVEGVAATFAVDTGIAVFSSGANRDALQALRATIGASPRPRRRSSSRAWRGTSTRAARAAPSFSASLPRIAHRALRADACAARR